MRAEDYVVGEPVWVKWGEHRFEAVVQAVLSPGRYHVIPTAASHPKAALAGAGGGWHAIPAIMEPRHAGTA